MKLSLRRIVLQRPQQTNINCLICTRSQFIPFNLLFTSQYRQYSDNVEQPDSKEETPSVESTGTVPDDPDIIKLESSIQKSPLTPTPIPPEIPNPTFESSSLQLSVESKK